MVTRAGGHDPDPGPDLEDEDDLLQDHDRDPEADPEIEIQDGVDALPVRKIGEAEAEVEATPVDAVHHVALQQTSERAGVVPETLSRPLRKTETENNVP